MINSAALILAGLLLSLEVIATPIYKWVDEDGQVHYGLKPLAKDATEVKIRDRYIDSGTEKPAATTQERVERQKRFVDALKAEEKSIRDEKAKKDEEENQRFLRCVAARNQLKRAEQSAALYNKDKQGNRVILTDAQHKKYMQQARARVAKWCE